MNAIERLREYAEATRWGGVCRVLHAHHGDFEGDCLERECNECRAAYLRAVADGADAELRDMNARLMPEGMSWPRYTDGSLVEIGDEVVGSDYGERINVDAVKFHANGFTLCGKGGFKKRYECDDLFERLAKVLDADGVEVEVGDDLYSVEGMLKFHVSAIDKKSGRIATEAMFALGKWADPKTYTHRAPVLAADGKPLEVGQTVYLKTIGKEYIVEEVSQKYVLAKEPDAIESVDFNEFSNHLLLPSQLTHQRPVLDADGVEIRVGDEVYQMGCKYRVSHLHGANGKVRIVYENSGRWVDPKTLTHRAPVLAVDGKQLREGETVYVLGFGDPLTVKGFADDGRVLMSFHDENSLGYKPSKLTHEQPDTWARIEDDAKKNACEVFHPGEEECGGCRFEGNGNCEEELRLELVKRCKALAERS